MSKKIIFEELNRMKYLFGHKRGVVISEQTDEFVDNKTDDAFAEDRQVLASINKDLNDSVSQVQDSFIGMVQFQFDKSKSQEDFIVLNFYLNNELKQEIQLQKNKELRQWVTAIRGIRLGQIPLPSDFSKKILENPTYSVLFKKYPMLTTDVTNCKVSLNIGPLSNNGVIIKASLNPGKGEYGESDKIKLTELMSSNEGSGSNSTSIKLDKKMTMVFEMSNCYLDLKVMNLSLDAYIPKGEPMTGTSFSGEVASIDFDNGAIDLFKFDETNFKDEAKAKELIDSFIAKFENLKTIYKPKIYDSIISFYSGSPITVHGYASRDADPNQTITGGYSACSGFGNGTRGQYNQCLSQARADRIATILNERLPFLKFVGQGHGETDKFNGIGWKPGGPKKIDNKTTGLNRRFQIFLPKYELKNMPKEDIYNVQTQEVKPK